MLVFELELSSFADLSFFSSNGSRFEIIDYVDYYGFQFGSYIWVAYLTSITCFQVSKIEFMLSKIKLYLLNPI